MRPIRAIVIHCSASPNGRPVTLEDIDSWHKQRGWKGVGYHYVIEADGTIREGRPINEIGAHVAGSNAKTIGICMVGTDKFSRGQWESLSLIHDQLGAQFPEAQWLGHRDFSPDKDGDGYIEEWEWVKTCPGFDVREWENNNMIPRSENMLE